MDFEQFEEWDDRPFEDFDNLENIEVIHRRAPKRYIRDFENPFERFNDAEFKTRFRFHKDAVMHGLLPKIEEGLRRRNRRGLPIEPPIELLVALRFYATASFQTVCGDLEHISQSTVSKTVFRVSLLLASLMPEVIKMPATAEKVAENRRLFHEIGRGGGARVRGATVGLPGIDGAIDCTHIRLSHSQFRPYPEAYRNRKGWISLNVQTVVGPRMEFLNVVPEWPGREHDSRIFQNSRIFMQYMEGQHTGRLVGDAGYPTLPFLLTPVNRPQTRAEERYNYVHSRTRMPVERTNGVWKRRFPCLSRGLGNKLLCSTAIIGACAVLHNLSLILDNILPQDEEPPLEEEDVPVDAPHWQPGDGFAVRTALIQQLF